MYQWLLGALGALLAAARRPAPPPAPPPLKRPPPSVLSPLEDPDQNQPKKPKPDYAISELIKKVEEVPAVVNLAVKAPNTCQKPSFNDASPITESAKETQLASSDPSSKTPGGSAIEIPVGLCSSLIEPSETNTCLNVETLDLSPRTVPCVSASWNGRYNIRPAPDNILTLRPPLQEVIVPQTIASEVSKMGKLFSTTKEDVKRGETVKYKQLLELVKAKYPRRVPNPQLTTFCNVQAYSKEPATTVSHWEEQRSRGNSCPGVLLRTSNKSADVCSLQRNDVIRSHTPAANSCEQRRPVKEAVAQRQTGAEVSEEVLLELHLAPVLPRKSSAPDVKEKRFRSLEKRVEHFPPLTEAMEREVMAAFGEGEPSEIMSSAFKLKVTREDIHTLSNLCWLNDEVINFYMNLLVERNKKEGYPAVHAFSTFFYPRLISGGYNTVRRWTKGVDLFKQDLIFVPIHLRVHWALVVIDVRDKTIKYFDSMAQRGDTICETLFKYLQEESREKRNQELTLSEWTLHSMEPHEIPQQMNGSDCGVFACKYADYISRDKPITFTQNHMPYFRRKMVWEIIHQQLL